MDTCYGVNNVVYVITTPEGETIETSRLYSLCKAYKLNAVIMGNVAKERRYYHKGFRCSIK